MNLSPEEKKIGKENFQEAVGTTRRDFLKGSIAATVAAAASARWAATTSATRRSTIRLRVGIIGTGDEGNVLIGALNPDYIDVVAIADIRPYSVHRAFYGDWYSPGAHSARPGLLEVYKREGWADRAAAEKHIKVYTDGYDELLDDPNVEAVIIAVPLHLHHPVAIAAMRKGKHVLTEKLMAHDVGQCKEMARAAAQLRDPNGNPIVFAVGHQRHYSILYDNAVDQIKQGLIGDIHHIRAQWHRDNLPGNDSWQPPLPGDKKLAGELDELGISARRQASRRRPSRPIPADITEWKRKIAQKQAQINDISNELAAKYGYQAKTLEGGYNRSALEELIRWRLWNRTGGGLMAELGSHQLDAASIFITAQRPDGRKAKPLSVVGRRRPQHLPRRPRVRRPRLLHLRVPRPRLLRRRSEPQGRQPEQEDRRHLFVDQRQRLRRLRRNRLRHQGHADPRTGTGRDALHRLEHRHARSKSKPAKTASRRWTRTKPAAARPSPRPPRPKTPAAATAKRSSTGPGASAIPPPNTSRVARRKSPSPTR